MRIRSYLCPKMSFLPQDAPFSFETNILSQYDELRADDDAEHHSFEVKLGARLSSPSSASKFKISSRLSEINIPDVSFDMRSEDRLSRISDVEYAR